MGKGLCLSTACLCRAGCRDGFTGRDLRGEGQSRRRQLVHRVPPTTSPRPVPFRSPHRGEPTFVPGRPSPATGGVRREPAASSPGSAPAAASPGERHRPPPGLPHIFLSPPPHAFNSFLSPDPPRFRRCKSAQAPAAVEQRAGLREGGRGERCGGCASIAALHKAICFLNRGFRCDYGNTRIM